jgi:lipopolysaccharide export LptBFGC system permease protein LptF
MQYMKDDDISHSVSVQLKSLILKLKTMNTGFKFVISSSFWVLVTSQLFAQEQITTMNKTPRWISTKGFWQIESNIHSPDQNIVYFYNKENTLVYKEYVEGVIIDLNNKRVKMRLKRALEAALLSWNKTHLLQNDRELVSVLLKR